MTHLPDLDLYTPADLAERFGVTERKVLDWRREFNWPCVRLGRTIRFTQAHFEQIVVAHSQAGAKVPLSVTAAGQTARSAARRKAS